MKIFPDASGCFAQFDPVSASPTPPVLGLARFHVRRLVGIVLSLAVLGGLGAPSAARAQAALEYGPFRIVPYLSVSEEYDDNVTLAPSGFEESDFITYITPGLGLKLRGPTYGGNLTARVEFLRYAELTGLDTTRYYVTADGRTEVGSQLKLTMADEFAVTNEFVGGPVPTQTDLVQHLSNTFELGGEYRLTERYSVGLDYRFYWIDYLEGGSSFENLSYYDQTIALSLYYQLFPKTAVFAQYAYEWIRYPNGGVSGTRNSDSHQGYLGVRGDLTAKTSAQLKLGYGSQDYTGGFSVPGPLIEGAVIYKYREPSQIRFFITRTTAQSTSPTDNNTRNLYYWNTYGGIDITHQLNPRLAVKVLGLVGTNEYPDPMLQGTQIAKESDLIYLVGAAVHYDFRRWCAIELTFNRRSRDSNFSSLSYDDNRIRLSIILTY